MSGFTASADSNMKQVMRTALVGVTPADQLMLKGYLRVLLRLEVDLEWVPANHPKVDLLFINNEFRNSESVVRLLSGTSTPVLFVKRDPNGQGDVVDDTLILPLKKLDVLSKWLASNISVLMKTGSVAHKRSNNTSDMLLSTADTIVSNRPTPSSATTAARSTSPFTANSNTGNSSEVMPTDAKRSVSATASPKFDVLIDFAKIIGTKPKGLYEILANGMPIAFIDVTQQKVWPLVTEQIKFDVSWQLNKVDSAPPDTVAKDLFQWLWSRIWQTPQALTPLISDNQSYQLKYWPKPEDRTNRTELLNVFTALESSPKTVNQVAALADTSVNMVKKVLVGLLFAGGLQDSTYASLQAPVAAKPVSNEPKVSSETSPASKVSALDAAIARRASGQSAAVSSTADIQLGGSKQAGVSSQPEMTTSQPPVANKEKRGFLSKLRNKLGL